MSPAFACAVCNGKCLDDEAMGWVFLWREVAAPLIQYIVPTDYVARDKMGETKERKRKRTAVVLWCRRSLFDCFQTHLGLVRRPSWSIELSLSSLSCSVYSVCVICQQVSPGLADQLKEASMTLTRLLLASLPPSTDVMTADGSEICPFPIDYFSLSLSLGCLLCPRLVWHHDLVSQLTSSSVCDDSKGVGYMGVFNKLLFQLEGAEIGFGIRFFIQPLPSLSNSMSLSLLGQNRGHKKKVWEEKHVKTERE